MADASGGRRVRWVPVFVALTLMLIVACSDVSGPRTGDAVPNDPTTGRFVIGRQSPGLTYAWGLPLLTTREGRRITLKDIRIVQSPPEAKQIVFRRLRYADYGRGIGIIDWPTGSRPEGGYTPLPALGVTYDDVNDDQIVVEFQLSAPVRGVMSGISIVYEEDGEERKQVIDASLRIGSDS